MKFLITFCLFLSISCHVNCEPVNELDENLSNEEINAFLDNLVENDLQPQHAGQDHTFGKVLEVIGLVKLDGEGKQAVKDLLQEIIANGNEDLLQLMADIKKKGQMDAEDRKKASKIFYRELKNNMETYEPQVKQITKSISSSTFTNFKNWIARKWQEFKNFMKKSWNKITRKQRSSHEVQKRSLFVVIWTIIGIVVLLSWVLELLFGSRKSS